MLLSECEREPIHIPGRIQPFGVLLTVDPENLTIQNISENCLKLWDRHSFALLGRNLTEFLSDNDLQALKAMLGDEASEAHPPLRLTLAFDEYIKREWEVRVHRYQDVHYLECEPAAAAKPAADDRDWQIRVRGAVQALQSTASLQHLCDEAVRHVQALTGFGRVMVYRFDEEWHGTVIAEACDPAMESYLGLRYPASDIPAQARAIFLQNWLRMIPDVDYTPARIYPGTHPQSNAPLDLSKATLRSVSPVHLQYLRNMAVKASLTISLVSEGRLWGLIACHHASPRLIDSDARLAAELIGHLVSAQLAIKEENEERGLKNQLRQQVDELLPQLAQEQELGTALERRLSEIAKLAEFGGIPASGVAVRYAGVKTGIGVLPPPAEIDRFLEWGAENCPDQELFLSHQLSRFYQPAQAWLTLGSGVLLMWINREQREAIVWFRPEVMTTVTWAGEPKKAVSRGAGNLLHPRSSFAAWKEIVRGTAVPWKTPEIEAICHLRSGIITLALQQERRLEQVAKEQAERLGREKDEMVAMVSHDLKTPLSVLTLSFDFFQRNHPAGDSTVQRMMERAWRAIRMMESLVVNILDVVKIEAGTMDLRLKPVNALDLVNEATELSLPLAQEKKLQLLTDLPSDGAPYPVCCERLRISQVLSNLIGNALKFTPAGGRITVAIEPRNEEVRFSVADTGEGIPQENLEKIFARFWQAEDTRRLGSGLGLWITKGIIETHGGKIWAESKIGEGSIFYFTLPRPQK